MSDRPGQPRTFMAPFLLQTVAFALLPANCQADEDDNPPRLSPAVDLAAGSFVTARYAFRRSVTCMTSLSRNFLLELFHHGVFVLELRG